MHNVPEEENCLNWISMAKLHWLQQAKIQSLFSAILLIWKFKYCIFSSKAKLRKSWLFEHQIREGDNNFLLSEHLEVESMFSFFMALAFLSNLKVVLFYHSRYFCLLCTRENPYWALALKVIVSNLVKLSSDCTLSPSDSCLGFLWNTQWGQCSPGQYD